MQPNWQDDIKDDSLPTTLDAYERGPGELKIGQRIGWWYIDDAEYADQWQDGIDLARHPPYSGVVIPQDDIETRSETYDPEDMVVVMDQYPVEKCYCETTWIAYRRLLANEELVQVVVLE